MIKEISLDQPLLEQVSVREILFPEKEGLISTLTLQRLLEVTRILIKNQLKQKFPSYELTNLVVGYDVFTEDENGQIPKQTPQRFSVEWKHEALKKSIVIDPNSLVTEFLDVLLLSLQETLKEFIPQSFKDKVVHACLLVSLVEEEHIDEVLSSDSLMLSKDGDSGESKNLLSITSIPRFTHDGACNCYDDIRNLYVRRNSNNGKCPPDGQGTTCPLFGRKNLD